MQGVAGLIQEAAGKLLLDKQVGLVIGFSRGSLPLRSAPCFIRRPDEAEKLVWDRSCENNLANYLRRYRQKVAVVAKGCDSRAIVALLQEKQLERENIYIIGVPCSGMIDRKKVKRLLGGKELLEIEEKREKILLKAKGISKEISSRELLHESCRACRYPNPVLYDQLIGEPVAQWSAGDFNEVLAFEERTAQEKKERLAEELSKCIRCYACRNACPMCYCGECFADCSTPQWVGKGAQAEDNLIFQAVRVFHLAGRCVDCGACERACPMDIHLSLLTRKMVKDVRELYGFEAGVDPEAAPPLAVFSANDAQDFLFEE